jgi:hypothetical protein
MSGAYPSSWLNRLEMAALDEHTESVVGPEGRRLIEKYPYLGIACDVADDGEPAWQALLVRAFSAAIEHHCFYPRKASAIMEEILDAIDREYSVGTMQSATMNGGHA